MRKVIKKSVSAVLIAGMISSMYVPVLAQEDSAKLEFDASGVTYSNIDWVAYNNGSITEIGGRPALQLKDHEEQNLYISAALADKWLYAPEGAAVEFDIEYYDTGTGSFTIAYDSTHNNDVGSKDAEIVRMTGDNKWKKATLYVGDIRAVNSFGGGDFRLGLWSETMNFSDDDIYIGSIEVRKVFPKHPIEITITTPYYGNIFGGQEERILDVNFRDLTNERMDTEVSYIVTDENGQTVKTGMIAENPDVASETVKLDLNDITKFGLYDIDITAVSNIELDGETKQFTSTASTNFSVINKSEIGETNWRNGACTHSGTGWWPVGGTAEIARWAGFGSVRDEIFWSNIETKKGQYVMTQQGQQYIDKLRENGLKLLYISNGNNPLYYAEGGDFVHTSIPTNDEGIKAHAKFCAWMTKEYNDVLAGMEIWNEPNTPAANHFQVDGAAYTKLLRDAYKEIKAVDPNMPVLAPGCEPGYSEWSDQMFPAKSYEVTDVFVAHTYNWDRNKFVPEDYVARFDNVKENDKKYDVLDKPRWFTEFGFTTGEEGKVFEGSEREQAQTAVREYVTGVAENLFERTYWYDLISDGNSKGNIEHNFGLVKYHNNYTSPYAAKPAYVAMAGMNKFLTDAEYVDKIYANKEYYAFRFKKNGEDIAVLWANRGNEQSVSFNFGTDSVEVFDKYTNSEGKLTGKDGVFSFALGEDPIYIKGNFSKFEKADAEISQSTVVTDILPNDSFSINLTDTNARNLTIAADTPDGVTAEIDQMTNGKATVKLTTEKEIPEYMVIKLNAYDGNNMVFTSFVELCATEPINMDVSASQPEENNPDQWQAEVTITNNSYTKAISGKCQIVSMDGEENLSNAVPFADLKGGESVKLFINLDTMVKKRNTDLTVRTALDYGYEQDFTKSIDFTSAGYATEKPVIDGKLNIGEWKGTWMTGDKATRVKEMLDWGGKEDLSFDCNVMWDEENLYVAANVTDNVFCQNEVGANIWRGDMFQFAIEDKLHNGDFVLAGGGVDVNFTEFGAALVNNSTPILYRYNSEHNKCPNGIVENVDIAIKREGSHIIYEMAIPWTEIFGAEYEFDASKIFGFSMLANDNDGEGRRGWIEYNSGIGSAKNGLLFGKMPLVGKN